MLVLLTDLDGLFTADPAVVAAGAEYFTIVGPAYAFFGMGMAMYFAAQGTGQMAWPLAAGVVRLAIIAGAGWLAAHILDLGLAGTYGVIALALVVFGAINAAPWLLRLFDPAWTGNRVDPPLQNAAR